MFTSWLLEQDDREDSVGRLSRLVQADYSAGCASLYKDAVAWKVHFEQKHPKKFGVLLELLSDAYVEYCTEFSEQDGAV
jgi:hypothetical protein